MRNPPRMYCARYLAAREAFNAVGQPFKGVDVASLVETSEIHAGVLDRSFSLDHCRGSPHRSLCPIPHPLPASGDTCIGIQRTLVGRGIGCEHAGHSLL